MIGAAGVQQGLGGSQGGRAAAADWEGEDTGEGGGTEWGERGL